MSTLLYNPYRVKWFTKEKGVEKVPKTVYAFISELLPFSAIGRIAVLPSAMSCIP